MSFSDSVRKSLGALVNEDLIIRTGTSAVLYDEGYVDDVVLRINVAVGLVERLTWETSAPFHAEFWSRLGAVVDSFAENEFQLESSEQQSIVYSDYDSLEGPSPLTETFGQSQAYCVFRAAVLESLAAYP